MENKEQISSEEIKIQGLLDRYLHFRSTKAFSGSHLDEDSLNAFVEGSLTKCESSPILKHLIDCSFCLNVTAELAKLEMAFADDAAATVSIPATEPTKVYDVLKGILSRIFGTQDDAVFAHQEKEEEQETENKENQ